jgi:hypothetical protein
MRKALVVLALIAGTRPAAAQSIYTLDLLRDLPAGGNLFALIEAGGAALEVFLDTHNLLNMSNEVEEYVVTCPRFRETTAVQPPRSFHLGARVTF